MERTFAIRYSPRLRWLFALVGLGQRRSSVVLSDDALRVRMGPWFRAEIPRDSIVAARHNRNIWWAVGVHTDFRKSWLVNGAASGIVFIDVEPPARGRFSFFPANVRHLGLGLEDPDAFLAALAVPGARPSGAATA